MRPRIVPGGWLERLALWANLAPAPAADATLGMAMSRAVMAGVELGVFALLARQPASAEVAAERCGLDPAGTRHLLECLAALGHLDRSGEVYRLARRARRWLDPQSPTHIGGFLAFNYLQWGWWSELEQVVRSGRTAGIHDWPADDPRWDRYITGMFELARLSAPEAARRLRLPRAATRVLDLGGGHGWFAAELCRRHPGLCATVMDLPGSVRVGRSIIAREGMAGRVSHVEGDLLCDPLGGPYDAVLCFQLIHHLTPEQNAALFSRIGDALRPGGVVAALDYFAPDHGPATATAALLGLHFHLTSASRTYRSDDLRAWLQQAGFGQPRRIPIRRLPIQSLYEATKR